MTDPRTTTTPSNAKSPISAQPADQEPRKINAKQPPPLDPAIKWHESGLNASSSPPAGPRSLTRPPPTGPCSAGRTTTTPADATPRSATSHPTPTKRACPLLSRKQHNRDDTVSKIEGQGPSFSCAEVTNARVHDWSAIRPAHTRTIHSTPTFTFTNRINVARYGPIRMSCTVATARCV